MKPFMPKNYPHGLVMYDEYDILLRNNVVQIITNRLKTVFQNVNPAIRFIQVETPTLTPSEYLQSHIAANFELINTDNEYLRPETTCGSFEAIKLIYPQAQQLKKALPLCVWQVGKSYRNEQTRPFGELRFTEFYQLEYQLIYTTDTKMDYHSYAVECCSKILGGELFKQFLDVQPQEKLPHYSVRTTDLYMNEREIIGISSREDFEHPVLEVACGLDRICHLMRKS